MEDTSNTRQRIDYEALPDGGLRAILTITIGDRVERYQQDLSADEVAALNAAEVGDGSVAGLFSFVGKGLKAIGKVAKSIVTSKVMKTAAAGLAIVAPALGPLAPAALGASAAIGVAGKLAAASGAAKAGRKAKAKAIAADAVKAAGKIAKGDKAKAKALLAQANEKRKAVERVALSAFGKANAPALRKAAAATKAQAPNILAAARAGRVRSNKPGAVNAAQLTAAAKAGRVFWVA